MAGHTPGPWVADVDADGDNLLLKAGEETIIGGCGCCGSPYMPGPATANARLIAAAPDMLEALLYVETRCVSEAAYPHASLEARKMRDLVVAAISKAEGTNVTS